RLLAMPGVMRSPLRTSRPVAAPTADRNATMNRSTTRPSTSPRVPKVGIDTCATATPRAERRKAASTAATWKRPMRRRGCGAPISGIIAADVDNLGPASRCPLISSAQMRYLVLSDLHANLPALDAVLLHAKQRGYDDVMFLGDAVGYYPHPEEVVQRLMSLEPAVRIMGNHDAALLAMIDEKPERVRDASVVTEVLERHLAQLSNDSVRFLQGLRPTQLGDGWEAAHGALVKPWEYMSSLGAAQANVPLMKTQLLFVG